MIKPTVRVAAARLSVALFVATVNTSICAGQCIFEDVTQIMGLGEYVAQSGDDHGPGAVWTDLDNDGYPDLYLPGAGATPANRIYHNVPHTDGTRLYWPAASAADQGECIGAVAADYDNDGDIDLYVLNFNQPNRLWQSQFTQTGELLFVDVTDSTDPTPDLDDDQFGVATARFEGVWLDNSLTAAWSDVDRDGDLDLYVGNHNGWYGVNLEGPFEVPGRRDVFYVNNGDGTFSDATMQLGVCGFETSDGQWTTLHQRFSSTNAVVFADFNNDRWPDLLVTNKIGGPTDRDMLYVNRGGSPDWLGFALVTHDLAPTFGHVSPAAMGVDVADVDNDGDLDAYITDWSPPGVPHATGPNELLRNQLMESGELAFVIDQEAAPAIFSWGVQLQDFDLDGRVDLHVATHEGFTDFLYMNEPGGFVDIAQTAGVGQMRQARGSLSADANADGWPDLLVMNWADGPSVLYENNTASLFPKRRSIWIKLKGDPQATGGFCSTRDAIGARLRISADLDGDGVVGALETQIREVRSGSSNAASTSSLALEVGINQAPVADLEVLWPSGATTSFQVQAGSRRIVDEAALSPGDFNGDGRVNVDDLHVIVQTWGECHALPAVCLDQDQSGAIDIGELLMIVLHWRP